MTASERAVWLGVVLAVDASTGRGAVRLDANDATASFDRSAWRGDGDLSPGDRVVGDVGPTPFGLAIVNLRRIVEGEPRARRQSPQRHDGRPSCATAIRSHAVAYE